LSSPIANCHLITSEEIKQARLTNNGLTNLCKKNISNAFENVPFADQVFEQLGSVPAEMLYVSGTGLLKHMFSCLDGLIGGTKSKKRDKEYFDDLHRCLVINMERQCKHDFPCMSICNGITDGTKMCCSERVGNCFVLLCVMHTHLGKELMSNRRKQRKILMKRVNKMSETLSGI
jgi:hypothetical protein